MINNFYTDAFSVPNEKAELSFLKDTEEISVQRRKPGYFIQVPSVVLYEPSLSPGSKLLFGEISLLAAATQFCFASNAYFAANYSVSIRTVENWLKELKNFGLIRIEVKRNQNKHVEQRRIYVLFGSDVKGCTSAEEKPARSYSKNQKTNRKRISLVKESGCDEISEEDLKNLPF